MKHSKLGRKILIFMLISSLGVSLIISCISYIQIRRMYESAAESTRSLGELSSKECSEKLLEQTESLVALIANTSASNVDLVFDRVEKEVNTAVDSMTSIYANAGNFQGWIPALPSATENGVMMGRGKLVRNTPYTQEIISEQRLVSNIEYTASGLVKNDPMLRMILVGTESGIFYRYSDYNDFTPTYDPRTRDWYKNAVAANGNIVWSNAYFEAYGNLVVSCSRAFFGPDGTLKGAICSDITIEDMMEDILSQTVYSDGYIFMLDSDGKYIAHPDYLNIDFSRDPLKGHPERTETIKNMVSGKTGTDIVETGGKKYYISYAPVKTNDWSLALVIPFDSVTAPAQASKQLIDSVSAQNLSDMEDILRRLNFDFSIMLIICILLILAVSYMLTEMIRRPVSRLAGGAEKMGRGDLSHHIEVRGDDEIAMLGHSFNKMADDLQEYIKDLTDATKERERLDTELSVARKIQAELLPEVSSALPYRDEFSIAASMTPAKEVGGDFYDFFMVNDHELALVIGDVSGKGIPAALFMAMTKTLIKNQSFSESSVKTILEKVNNQLCENNGEEMFVTVWMAVIDIATGHMRCANAGHEFPVIGHSGAGFEIFKDRHGLVLAGMTDIKYNEYELDISEGDTIFVYTDGVTESQNSANELFGLDRTVAALNSDPDASPAELLVNVRRSIDEFAGPAPQFDDLTMLCYRQKKVSGTL